MVVEKAATTTAAAAAVVSVGLVGLVVSVVDEEEEEEDEDGSSCLMRYCSLMCATPAPGWYIALYSAAACREMSGEIS